MCTMHWSSSAGREGQMPPQVEVHRLMFPVAGATYDPVQRWALEDCRPLGKPQLCRGQSACNCALNFCGSCGLRLYHLNYSAKNPNAQTVSPLLSPQVQGRERGGAWWRWVSHMLSAAASLPCRAFSKPLSQWSQAAHLSLGHRATAGAFHGLCLSSSGQLLCWVWERCWLCLVALQGEEWAPQWPLPASALSDPKEKLWNWAVYI